VSFEFPLLRHGFGVPAGGSRPLKWCIDGMAEVFAERADRTSDSAPGTANS
jgi:hypothetical protein